VQRECDQPRGGGGDRGIDRKPRRFIAEPLADAELPQHARA
jgi:hypothetical protein